MTSSNQRLQKLKLGHRKIARVTGARKGISRARDPRGETTRQKGKNLFPEYHTMVHVCAFKRYFHLTFAKKYETLMTLKSLINETFPDSEQHSGIKVAPSGPGAMNDLVACEQPRQPTYTTNDPSTKDFKKHPPSPPPTHPF